MAHFAELDDNNIVTANYVVANDALDTANEEESGIAFLKEFTGRDAIFRQCSYNGNFRKKYPAKGYIYNETLNAFIEPQPYPSWSLDADGNWLPPVAKPEGNSWIWNESAQEWVNVEANA